MQYGRNHPAPCPPEPVSPSWRRSRVEQTLLSHYEPVPYGARQVSAYQFPLGSTSLSDCRMVIVNQEELSHYTPNQCCVFYQLASGMSREYRHTKGLLRPGPAADGCQAAGAVETPRSGAADESPESCRRGGIPGPGSRASGKTRGSRPGDGSPRLLWCVAKYAGIPPDGSPRLPPLRRIHLPGVFLSHVANRILFSPVGGRAPGTLCDTYYRLHGSGATS
jgi:hypothetical protein